MGRGSFLSWAAAEVLGLVVPDLGDVPGDALALGGVGEGAGGLVMGEKWDMLA